MLVVKRGPMGCAVIDGADPGVRSTTRSTAAACDVEVLNVLGAGDAFSAGFLSGWVRGEDYDACARYANACGALVVSRHGCAPAMPTRVELDYFLANAASIPRPDQDATLTRLHRVTAPRAPRDEVLAFAFDHRNQFFELAQQAGADEARIPQLKQLFVDAVADRSKRRAGCAGRVGILCDDRYGQDALNAATGRGWWIGRPVELPGSNPVVFDRGRSIGTTLIALAAGARRQVPRRSIHPDDAVDNRLEQEAQIRALYDAVQASGHELLLEIIPPQVAAARRRTPCYRAMKRLYNLEHLSRVVEARADGRGAVAAIDALIAERDPYCRGVRVARAQAPASTRSRRASRTRAAADVPRLRRRPHGVSGARRRSGSRARSTTRRLKRACARISRR